MHAPAGTCSRSCGNMSVPYPFGIGPSKCYLRGFNLTCDTSRHPPQLMLGSLRVVNISLRNNTMCIISTYRDDLFFYGGPGGLDLRDFRKTLGDMVPYSLSTSNELSLMGCGVQMGLFTGGSNRSILSGCSSFCFLNQSKTYDAVTASRIVDDGDEYCYGNGCCQARISMSMDGMPSHYSIDWLHPAYTWDKTLPPSYMFIAEEGWFNKRRVSAQLHSSLSTKHLAPTLEFPIVLDWEILQLQHAGSPLRANVSSLQRQQQYLKCPGISCKSKNSLCKPRNRGYTCHCNEGYDGNPYLINGCKGYNPCTHPLLIYLYSSSCIFISD